MKLKLEMQELSSGMYVSAFETSGPLFSNLLMQDVNVNY